MRAEQAQDRLREIVSQPDTVLFVGSGVSAWSGLPTWRGLIAELADFLESRGFPAHLVRRELEQGDLLQAASFGFDVLTPQGAATFLRQACRYGGATPSPLHRCLATLGPRAFITTNYDKLLEQTLAVERSELSFQLVNNVDQVETASIIQSRARDFVFKPHGDIDASASIVLTREQYRALQHEKRYAFEAFKTLMASRPVLFVGFGLRDPDFLLIKDTLAAIYLGAAQDHYAIAPDIDDQEADYWRNSYGIHLISYEKNHKAADPGEQHAALLDLLKTTASSDAMAGAPSPRGSGNDSATLALLRHARRMVQLAPPADTEILPLAASRYPGRDARVPSWETRLPFVEGDAVTGLQRNRTKLLLTGAPGAGKTFVVKAAVARMAQEVIDEGLQSEGGPAMAVIPAYVDLRDYSGNLWRMTVESFPLGFPLDELIKEDRVAFFVDGLNEVSAQIVEDNTLAADLETFLDRTSSCSIVLVTRFGDEHGELKLPEIALESIPRNYVLRRLKDHGVPETAISQEFLNLLERPVFYRFCVELGLWDSRTPHAIYTAVLLALQNRAKQFGSINLLDLFGRIAFDAIDDGDLLISASALAFRLEDKAIELDARTIINWLLTEGILVPRAKANVTFFHHSVTEYLAAYELAARFEANPLELPQILKGRRWDQVVLLSLGFLEANRQQEFFTTVMQTDVALGFRALAFIEGDWERWTSEALHHLNGLPLSWNDTFEITRLLESTRFNEGHEDLLLQLASQTGGVAGAAMGRTLDFGGAARVRRAIDSLFDDPSDYNRCSVIGRFLERSTIDLSEIRYLLDSLSKLQPDDETLRELEDTGEADSLVGLTSAAGTALGSVGLDTLRSEIQPYLDKPLVQIAVLDLLWEDGSSSAIDLATDLLEINPIRASVALHFQISHREDAPDLSSLHPQAHGPVLLEVEDLRRDGWALDTLRLLGSYSDDWLKWVNAVAENEADGLMGAMIWCAAHKEDRFFSELERLRASSPDWSTEPLGALSMISELSWQGHEDVFIALLREHHDDLAYNLIEGAHLRRSDAHFNDSIRPDDVGWWVEWLAEPREDGFFFEDRLGSFLADAASKDAVEALLQIFADGSPRERSVLAYHVLGEVSGLQLSDLPEDGLQWAVDDLADTKVGQHVIESSVLAKLATEDFVEAVLLPRFEGAAEPFRLNLLTVIRQAGERHRRRYLTTSGKTLG